MVSVEQKNGKFIITIEENKYASKGGNTVYASTHGNIPVAVGNRVMKLGVNLYSEGLEPGLPGTIKYTGTDPIPGTILKVLTQN